MTCSSDKNPGGSLCRSGRGTTSTVSASHCCNKVDSSRTSIESSLEWLDCTGLIISEFGSSSDPGVLGVDAVKEDDLFTAALTAVESRLDKTCFLAMTEAMGELSSLFPEFGVDCLGLGSLAFMAGFIGTLSGNGSNSDISSFVSNSLRSACPYKDRSMPMRSSISLWVKRTASRFNPVEYGDWPKESNSELAKPSSK